MGSPATRPVIHSAWVASCPVCTNCHILPGLPATEYVGRPIRPEPFSTNVSCYCGAAFPVDEKSLSYVLIAALGIQREPNQLFRVGLHYAGATNELGPMTETELAAYLSSRRLVGAISSQIVSAAKQNEAIHTNTVVSIVSPAEEEMIEGSLDILWENYGDSRATPKYALIFARYTNFKNGAQQPKRLIGADALEFYLAQIGFTSEDAKNHVKQVTTNRSVSIPNVFLAKRLLVDYGQ